MKKLNTAILTGGQLLLQLTVLMQLIGAIILSVSVGGWTYSAGAGWATFIVLLCLIIASNFIWALMMNFYAAHVSIAENLAILAQNNSKSIQEEDSQSLSGSLIRCKCGTENCATNKFCDNCGEAL